MVQFGISGSAKRVLLRHRFRLGVLGSGVRAAPRNAKAASIKSSRVWSRANVAMSARASRCFQPLRTEAIQPSVSKRIVGVVRHGFLHLTQRTSGCITGRAAGPAAHLLTGGR